MVVFACLPNFICNAVDPKASDHVQIQTFTDTIAHHLQAIRAYAESNPSTLVAVVQPLQRQSPACFFSQFLMILDVFNDLFSQYKVSNMHQFVGPDAKKLQFTGNLIHLTPKCGDQYVYSLFEQCGELFDNVSKYSSTVAAITDSAQSPSSSLMSTLFCKAVLDDNTDSESFKTVHGSPVDSDDPEVTIVQADNVHPSSAAGPVTLEMLYQEIKKSNNLVSKVHSHDEKIKVVQGQVSEGFKSTDLAIARLYEDQDFSTNVSKENRVTIGSLVVSEASLPTDRAAWIKFLTDRINSIIKLIFPAGSTPLPVLIGVAVRSTRLNFKKEFPNFDALFQSTADALSFRRTVSSASRHDGSPLKGLFVSNSVSLAIRVRIEVLLSLSRHLNQAGFISHVQSFVSRPVIHVKTSASPVSKVYTYIDCVKEFSGYFEKLDLTSAYRRAGTYFDGTLSRFFVFFNDSKAASLRTVTCQ